MQKYTIEGNIDFYKELYESLDDTKEPDTDGDESNMCLITNMPLTEHFVTMECSHKFNYLPLYNDILNHKKKYNSMERRALKGIEIRCPYCRNIQKKLLPYYESMNLKQVHGVNFFDDSYNYKKVDAINPPYMGYSPYNHGKCSYELCAHTLVKMLPQNKKYYCMFHKHIALKEYVKEQKDKLIQEKLKVIQQKKDLKLAEKKMKDDLKLAIKTAKDEAKANKKNTNGNNDNKNTIIFINLVDDDDDENVIISNNNVVKCQQLLKSGPKKGQPCGCSARLEQNNMCMRHYKPNVVIDLS